MNCPGCGRFMALLLNGDPPPAQEDGPAYVWFCTNLDCLYSENPLPAPEYDWRFWGISDEELAELQADDPLSAKWFEAMKDRCPKGEGWGLP